MKKILSFVLLVHLFAICALADNPICINDTVVKVLRPDSIVIIENDGTSTFQVYGNAESPGYAYTYSKYTSTETNTSVSEHASRWDFDFPFKKHRRKAYDSDYRRGQVGTVNFFFGFLNTINAPADMDVQMGASFETGLDIYFYQATSRDRRFSFNAGLDFTARYFRMTGRTRFVRNGEGNVVTLPYPAEATDIKASSLRVMSFGVPLRIGFNLPHKWLITLGAQPNINCNARIRNKYKLTNIGDEVNTNASYKMKETYKGLKTNRFSVDFMASVSWNNIGVYTRYSPCNVLNTNYGPSFTPISVGLLISL